MKESSVRSSSISSSRKKQGAAASSSSPSPCAACKLLRRRCTQECVFAPYFPADEPHKFASVHKVFGASNVNKLLQELPVQHRSDAVSSMVYEANARVRDPVYGCVGAISSLQQQIDVLQTQLALTQAEMVHMQMRHAAYLAQLGHGPDETTTTTGSGSPSSSLQTRTPSSPNLVELHNAKSLFGLDMVVDQSNIGQLMWSC